MPKTEAPKCIVAVGDNAEQHACLQEAVGIVRVPYLMGKTLFVPVCAAHRHAHNSFFAEKRTSYTGPRQVRRQRGEL